MFALALLDIVVDIGRVESQQAEPRGSTWVTRSVVRLDDGGTTIVEHLGGSRDGIGVRVVGMPTLATGEHVAIWRDGTRLLVRTAIPLAGRREYVQATATSSGAPLSWADTNCMSMVPNVITSRDVSPDDALEAVRRAAENWNDATGSCSHMALIVDEPRADVVPGYSASGDNTNVVYWREDSWNPEYPRSAAGITTLHFRDEAGASDAGEILDADIELNGVEFTFSAGGCDASAGQLDLENTLTHEMGHFLGLDHTCHDGSQPRPRDDQGEPVPDCSSTLPAEIRETTMFPVARACEDFMRTPEVDDIAGICGIYPLALDPGVCDPDPPELRAGGDGCACALGEHTPANRAGAMAAGFAALLLTGRACSRCRRRSGCAAASSGRPRASCAA